MAKLNEEIIATIMIRVKLIKSSIYSNTTMYIELLQTKKTCNQNISFRYTI